MSEGRFGHCSEPLDFTLLVTLVEFLLWREHPLRFQYIEQQFSLDVVTFDRLRDELVLSRGVASETEDHAFIWTGPDELHASVGATAPQAVRARPAQAPERRQLTVMFCDLVDSIALSTRIDPEDYRDVQV